MTMKTLILLSSLLYIQAASASDSAKQCERAANPLMAQFSVTLGNGETQQIILLRDGNKVARHNKTLQRVDIWQQNNQRVSLTRVFENYQRAIEYSAADIQQNPERWQTEYQIVSPATFAHLTITKRDGQGCESQVQYQSHDKRLSVSWLEQIALPKEINWQGQQGVEKWTLISLSSQKSDVAAHFALWQQLPTTDYSDIGDNESDEVLSKMIRQGFPTKPIRREVLEHNHEH